MYEPAKPPNRVVHEKHIVKLNKWWLPENFKVSPDGKRVAYVAHVSDKSFVVVDGERQQPYDAILDVLLFSPNSKRLAYGAQVGNECFMVLDGQEEKHYDALMTNAVFSYDSSRFAYGAVSGNKQFVVLDRVELKQYDRFGKGGLVFSPDSRRIAYKALLGDQWFVVVDEEECKRYDGYGSTLVFSPNSQHLVYGAKLGEKWFVVVNEQEQKPYDGIGEGKVIFSPDSRRLAYGARMGNKECVIVNGKEGKGYDAVGEGSLIFSADSTRFAYVAGDGKKWFTVIDGSEEKPYDDIRLGSLQFSADGSRFAYVARSGKKWFLVIDGKEGRRLDAIGNLILSPNNQRVAYEAVIKKKLWFITLSTDWCVVVDDVEGKHYEEVCEGTIFFDFPDDLRYLARKGDDIYLVEEKLGAIVPEGRPTKIEQARADEIVQAPSESPAIVSKVEQTVPVKTTVRAIEGLFSVGSQKESKALGWEKIYVFISSTFNDMHAERDYLVKRVFPELRDWCERRRLRLVDIDLRWGVTEADASSKRALKICLERINDCRPFFLCFLGQRHGWTPCEEGISSDTFDKFPDLHDAVHAAASITELEIRHAILKPFASRDSQDRLVQYQPAECAFFYFRDPGYLDDLRGAVQQLLCTYTDEVRPEGETDEERHKRELSHLALIQLRDLIIKATEHHRRMIYGVSWRMDLETPELAMPLQCPSMEEGIRRSWRKQWNRFAHLGLSEMEWEIPETKQSLATQYNATLTRGRLSGFHSLETRGDFPPGSELARIIQRDLQQAIQSRYPNHVEVRSEDDLQLEIDQHEQFVFLYSEGFVQRKGDFAELDEYAANTSKMLFALTAPGGLGKSTLLANWIDHYRTRIHSSPNETIHFRFIGASDRSTSVYSLLQLLLREIKDITGKFDGEIPYDPIKLRQTWLESLSAIGNRGKTLIVIDALNQLQTGLTDLNWLPQSLPENIKLIVSFKRGDEAAEELYQSWKDASVILSEVKPFQDLDDRRRLVKAYLSEYLKQLDEEHLDTLIQLEAASNPLYLKVVLSELRVFGAFMALAAKIRNDFGNSPVTAFQALLKRLERDPAYSPLEPEEAAPLLFGLLAHARNGLSVDELIDLFIQVLDLQDNEKSREASSDTINLLLRQVRPFLARREGLHDIFYESLKIAVQECYVAKRAEDQVPKRLAQEWHRYLARYFRGRVDPTRNRAWSIKYPRALRDLPYHMLEGGLYSELFELARDESFLKAQAAAFPGEPQLTLATLQAALQGAARIDDAPRMAEFVLSHARHIGEQETPLHALRADNLQRAFDLADVYDAELRVLWYLLLAWELKETGRLEQARATLQRLARMQLPTPSTWQPYTAYLLAQAYDLDDVTFLSLQQRLMDDKQRADLCKHLGTDGHFASALEIAHQISEPWYQAIALREIASFQAQANDSDASLSTFAAAREIAQALSDPGRRAQALRQIAVTLIGAKDPEASRAVCTAARKAAEKVNENDRSSVLHDIAVTQALAGDFAGASETAHLTPGQYFRELALQEIGVAQARARAFSAAHRTADGITRNTNRATVLREVAEAQACAGDADAARNTFHTALQVAQAIAGEPWLRPQGLAEIAAAQARVGEVDAASATFELALQTANKITRQEDRATAERIIVQQQIRAGLYAAALKTAQQIAAEPKRYEALLWIADAQSATAGDAESAKKTLDAALQCAQMIPLKADRAKALAQVAAAQMKAGQHDMAKASFASALQIAHETRNVPGEIEDRSPTLAWVAMAQAMTGNLSAALETIAAISGKLEQYDTLAAIAGSYASAGDHISAIKVVRATDSPQQALILDAIARNSQTKLDIRLRNAAEGEAVRTAIAEALKHAPSDDSARFEAETLVSIAAVQANDGAFSNALQTAQRIPSDAFRSKALRAIVVAQAVAGDSDATNGTYIAAREMAKQIASGEIRAEAGAAIAVAMDQELAFYTVYENEFGAHHQISIAGLHAIEHTREAIAIGQARNGRVEGAVKTASRIRSPELRLQALAEVAVAQIRAGETKPANATFEAAFKIADGLSESFERSKAFQKIAEAQAQAGKFAQALQTACKINLDFVLEGALSSIVAAEAKALAFDALCETVGEIAEDDNRAVAFGLIAAAKARAGDQEAARKYFAEALKTVQKIKDKSFRAKALGKIAVAQSQAGEVEAAAATFATCLELRREPKTLAAIAVTHAQAGLPNNAMKAAEKILTERNERLPEIASAFVELSDRECFKKLLIPCAHYLDAAYRMCGLIARSYPEQASAVTDILCSLSRSKRLAQVPELGSPDMESAQVLKGTAEAAIAPGRLVNPILTYLRLEVPDGRGHHPGEFIGFATDETDSTITLAPVLKDGTEPIPGEIFIKMKSQIRKQYEIPPMGIASSDKAHAPKIKKIIVIDLRVNNSLGLAGGLYTGFVVWETDEKIAMTPAILLDTGPWQPGVFEKASIASMHYCAKDEDLEHHGSIFTRKFGRNEPCPCGSGKKYKLCCGGQARQSR